jgi:hypothetical protein
MTAEVVHVQAHGQISREWSNGRAASPISPALLRDCQTGQNGLTSGQTAENGPTARPPAGSPPPPTQPKPPPSCSQCGQSPRNGSDGPGPAAASHTHSGPLPAAMRPGPAVVAVATIGGARRVGNAVLVGMAELRSDEEAAKDVVARVGASCASCCGRSARQVYARSSQSSVPRMCTQIITQKQSRSLSSAHKHYSNIAMPTDLLLLILHVP